MKKNYVIKTKDFILRPLKMSDKESLTKHVNDKIIKKNTLRIPYPYKIKDAEMWIKKCNSNYRKKEPTSISFGIEIANEIVGAIGLHDIEKGHKCRIGYWIGRKYWGQGIMTKVVKNFIPFAFKEYKLKRIQAEVFHFNVGSAKVLEKNGFEFEGIHKKGIKKNNKYIDEKIYALVK